MVNALRNGGIDRLIDEVASANTILFARRAKKRRRKREVEDAGREKGVCVVLPLNSPA